MPLPPGGWVKPTFTPRPQYFLPEAVESWWIGPFIFPVAVTALTQGLVEVTFSAENNDVRWRTRTDPTVVLVDTIYTGGRWDSYCAPPRIALVPR
jgi:hypothetical protein